MNSNVTMRAVAVAAIACCAAGAQAAPKSTVSYVSSQLSLEAAYVVDWNTAKHTAHVVEALGQGDGTYTDDGSQRVVTFKKPISVTLDTSDDCGEAITQTTTVTQEVFRPLTGTAKKGTAAVVDIGTITNVGGCEPGTTSFGTTTDAGLPTTLLDMTLRPATTDLTPGTQLAGMSETPAAITDYETTLVQQVATFNTGSVTFDGTGDLVGTYASDGWIVLDFGTFQRGYTRMSRNATTGVETWLLAVWQDGAPANAQVALMVKPNAAAGFGTHAQASHSWMEGLFAGEDPQIYFDLYTDSTGAFVYRALADGTVENSEPVTWSFVGANLQTKRSNDFTQGWRQRTWVPLANYGKNHFVMESDDLYDGTGAFLNTVILPRVNFYVDEGKAVKPAPALRAAAKATAKPVAARRAD